MRYPNFNEEKKLIKKGYGLVVGTDESGRGPLAGPVVAAAAIVRNFQFSIYNFQSIFNDPIFKKVKDSKKLSPKKREEIYKILIKHPDICFGVGVVSEKVIDKINIFEATKLAMKKALRQAQSKLGKKIDFIILDGNFKIDCNILQKPIVKGDEKVMSCALASIIAKVSRDKIMRKFHKNYPEYGFDRHKGYGTIFFFFLLEKYGPSVIHRKSFNLNGKIAI